MSIQSSAGVEAAANEIAAFIRERLVRLGPKEMLSRAADELRVVLLKVEEIRDSAQAGWD